MLTSPFGDDEFDLVYMPHVLEHFYPRDRDNVIRHIFRSLKPEGLLFIRVPHRSNMQGVGWEHHTLYQLNSFIGLTHGINPQIPPFVPVSNGVATTIHFDCPRGVVRQAKERLLNTSWNLTEKHLAKVMEVVEVQILVRKPAN